MPTYYVDPAASGANDGTSWTDAWETLQRAVDGTDGTQPDAGDTVLCRGTETLSAVVTFDGNPGTKAGGRVIYRGVNASGVNDGTRFVLDGNDQAIDIMSLLCDFIQVENFEVHNTNEASGYSGIVCDSGYVSFENHLFINCYIHNCYDGVYSGSGGMTNAVFIKCRFENNANGGVNYQNSIGFRFFYCNFQGNGGWGHWGVTSSRSMFIGCTILDNTGGGAYFWQNGMPQFVNCVINNNGGEGIDLGSGDGNYVGLILGCRITDNTVGIDFTNTPGTLMWSYMPDTGEDLANGTKTVGSSFVEPLINGVNTNDLSGTDVDGGYVDSVTDDYNLAGDATLRRTAIDLEE